MAPAMFRPWPRPLPCSGDILQSRDVLTIFFGLIMLAVCFLQAFALPERHSSSNCKDDVACGPGLGRNVIGGKQAAD